MAVVETININPHLLFQTSTVTNISAMPRVSKPIKTELTELYQLELNELQTLELEDLQTAIAEKQPESFAAQCNDLTGSLKEKTNLVGQLLSDLMTKDQPVAEQMIVAIKTNVIYAQLALEIAVTRLKHQQLEEVANNLQRLASKID